MQQGDVKETLADNRMLKDWIGEIKETNLEDGIKQFIKWYRDFYY